MLGYDVTRNGVILFEVTLWRKFGFCWFVCPFDYTAVAGSGKVGP